MQFAEYRKLFGRAERYSQVHQDDKQDVGSSRTSHEDSEEGCLEKETRYKGSQCNAHRRITDISITIIATLILTTFLQHTYHYLTFNHDTLFHNTVAAHYSEDARLAPKYHCGSTVAEARTLGCIFDLSQVGFVPPQCFDADLHRRFMNFGWKFYEDQNGTIEVPLWKIEESTGTDWPIWAQHGYHITHCELAWERMHLALQHGRRLTTHMLNLQHTKHCGMMNEMRDPLDSLNSQIVPQLATC